MLIGGVLFLCILLVAVTRTGDWGSLVFMAVVLIGLESFCLFLYYPRSFEIWHGELRYDRIFSLRKKFGGKGRKQVRTALKVAPIESVELKQNSLEKLFNTGRATFAGHAEIEFLHNYGSFYKEQVNAPWYHTLYGIKDFEKFRNAIYDYVDPTILTIKVKD